MNLFHIRYFVELAHTRHYTRAAEHLCISQPSLSHAIAQLEGELGVPLFEKTGRNTALTRYGEEFLTCAEQTLATLDGGVESLRRGARGEGLIRLGLLRTLGVDFIPELAARFLAAHPDREIQFAFHTGSTRYLLDGLLARRHDLAFCSQPPEEMKLTAHVVDQQDLVLIVPRDHPLAGRTQVDLEETLPYPYVCFSREAGLRGVVDGLFQQIGGEPRAAYEVEEDEVVAGLVSRGFGIAVVPYLEMLDRLEVQVIQITRPAWERNIYMVSDSRVFMPPVVQDFYQFVLDGGRIGP